MTRDFFPFEEDPIVISIRGLVLVQLHLGDRLPEFPAVEERLKELDLEDGFYAVRTLNPGGGTCSFLLVKKIREKVYEKNENGKE